MQIQTTSAQQTQTFAMCLANVLQKGIWIRLEGDLGAGKTTFTQGLGRALGVQRAIKSPTYTIIKEYELAQGNLVHVDAYRLEEGGSDTVDLSAYLDAQSIVLVEWAQFIEDVLPAAYIMVKLTYGQEENQRLIDVSVQGDSVEYQTLIAEWFDAWRQAVGENA